MRTDPKTRHLTQLRPRDRYSVDLPEGRVWVSPAGDLNRELGEFLKLERIECWAILQADCDEDRALLEKEVLALGFALHPARVAAVGEGSDEAGFFVLGIEKALALAFGARYGQEAILWGDGSGRAELQGCSEGPVSGATLEEVLLNDIHGCLHRDECATGCPQREALRLEVYGISPSDARGVIERWETEGLPELRPNAGGARLYGELFRDDLHYKRFVIHQLERALEERERDEPSEEVAQAA